MIGFDPQPSTVNHTLFNPHGQYTDVHKIQLEFPTEKCFCEALKDSICILSSNYIQHAVNNCSCVSTKNMFTVDVTIYLIFAVKAAKLYFC